MTSASVVSANLIRIAAALVLNPQGQTLLVRKRGTTAFMQPGGKIEAHELPVHALARELEEELGLQIDPAQAAFLGQFSAPAANEPGFVVQAQIFQLTIDTGVIPAAEIEEVIWVDPATDPAVDLAPLTRDLILPFYRKSLSAIA
jgi:8-oxo-dGTP pyrophosphatase MutT (NUDIX family)